MDIKNFISGAWQRGREYKYFLPNSINHAFIINNANLQEQFEAASFSLGELNAYARFVPDIDLFIRSHVTKEAVSSSRIEGTKTNMEEAYLEKKDVNPEHRDDWQEVNQYIKAMNYSLEQLEKMPFSNRLIKEAHKILLFNVRGKHKNPGEFRRSQNWIGGASIENAVFVPPSHEHVSDLMSDIEKFLHNKEIKTPNLIKVAIAHYQFETIHPFLDGNGRIGRLMITLYLVSVGMLENPLLYSSDFFEKHKGLYYDKLTFAREKNDLTNWIIFFLEAIEETSEKAVSSLQKISQLKDELITGKVSTLGRRVANAQRLLDLLFSQPVVSVKQVEKKLELSNFASGNLFKDFLRLGILKEITGHKRNRLFSFTDYLKILDS
jgi:Fic family protein